MSYATPPQGGFGQPVTGDPGTLDLPYYGIGFTDAVKRGLAKYARFDGRASRSEYWWWWLGVAVIEFVLYMLGLIIGLATADNNTFGVVGWVLFVIAGVFLLALLIPNLAISVRRLHDQNLSGLLALLWLVPSVGSIIMLILMLMPSKPEGARFDRIAPRV